ncbi:hypothetical protein C0992_011921 [Termitomyces sp. T32_za158]|nr:hypothetical protein C0992_011921 [Termitomyces sp. T32_za158]
MTVTRENAELIPKDTTNGETSRAGGSSGLPSYQAIPAPVQPRIQQQAVLRYRRSPARRFWLAFITAVFVWILVIALVQSWISVVVHWGNAFRKGEFNVPDDVSLSYCVASEEGWSHLPYPSPLPPFPEPPRASMNKDYFPYSSSTAFELPLSSRTLFLMARGTQTQGTVNVITSEELSSDVVKVYITVRHINKSARDHGIKFLSSDTAIFRTSNGEIMGSYNASKSLTLQTSNAPIHADVTVANDMDYVSDLALHTSNGKIDTRVHLESETHGGRYMVTATTSNAPLAVAFPSSPLGSTLKVLASTSNGHASLSLHPTYEGQFSMTTSNGASSIIRHDVVDPSGKGRVRQVLTNSFGRNVLSGRVSWSNEEGPGRVELRSSNAPITIEL